MVGRTSLNATFHTLLLFYLLAYARKKLRDSGNPLQEGIRHKIVRGQCTPYMSERNLNDSSFSIAVTLTALPTCDGQKVLAKKTNKAIADKRNIITIQVTFV